MDSPISSRILNLPNLGMVGLREAVQNHLPTQFCLKQVYSARLPPVYFLLVRDIYKFGFSMFLHFKQQHILHIYIILHFIRTTYYTSEQL